VGVFRRRRRRRLFLILLFLLKWDVEEGEEDEAKGRRADQDQKECTLLINSFPNYICFQF